MVGTKRALIFCAVAIPVAVTAGTVEVFLGRDICEAITAHGSAGCAVPDRLSFLADNWFVYALKSIVWIFLGVFAGMGAVLFADKLSER